MFPLFLTKLSDKLPCDNKILIIGHRISQDIKFWLETYPDASIWVLSDNREGILAAVRAGADHALQASIKDQEPVSRWLGACTFDLIITQDSVPDTEHEYAFALGKHLKKTGALVLCGSTYLDSGISEELENGTWNLLFYRNHLPKVTEKDHSESTSVCSNKVDVVIPLSCESQYDNTELRICLRSINKYMPNVGKVWVISDNPPVWLKNVNILRVPDKHRHNKDANLFDKLLSACINPDTSATFMFFSDDQCLIDYLDTETLGTVYNSRSSKCFTGSGTWHKRMANTFQYLESRGKILNCNFDGHVPMKYTKTEFIKAMAGVDYVPPPGFCINTLVCGLLNKAPEIEQNKVKVTVEGAWAGESLRGKLYVGYNDRGFSSGLKNTLISLFPTKSIYEA